MIPSAAIRRAAQAEFDKQHSIKDWSASGSHAAVAFGPLVIGVLLMGAAVALLLDRRFASRVELSTIGCSPCSRSGLPRLQCTRTIGSRSGVSSLAFPSLPSRFWARSSLSMERWAGKPTRRDAKLGTALAANRTLELRKESARRPRRRTPRASAKVGVGRRCANATARVDKIIGEMASLRTVNPDPRAEAIGDLADLLGFDKKRTVAIVSAVDPIALPTWLELGGIVFLATAFPARKRARKWRNRKESQTLCRGK